MTNFQPSEDVKAIHHPGRCSQIILLMLSCNLQKCCNSCLLKIPFMRPKYLKILVKILTQNWWTLIGHFQWKGTEADRQMSNAYNQSYVNVWSFPWEKCFPATGLNAAGNSVLHCVSPELGSPPESVICLRKRCKTERLPLHLSFSVRLIIHCQTSTEAMLTSGINWTQTLLIITKQFFSFRA